MGGIEQRVPDLEPELRVARALAREAGEILLAHRASGVERGTKAGGEIVTAADLEIDAAIRAGLAAAFPSDFVLSEEAPDASARLDGSRVWIVDPIDGTRDYADGGDEHAVSIGLAVGGRAVLGVVFNAVRDELFAGALGRGITVGDEPALGTTTATLASARLTVSRTEWDAGAHAGARSLPIRPMSSAAYKLARVAAGLDDGTFSLWPRREWDVCAGCALVVAAGGAVTLLDGSEITFNRPDLRLGGGIVAAPRALHAALRAALVALGLAQEA